MRPADRDISRLPRWAQDRIVALERDVEHLRAALAADAEELARIDANIAVVKANLETLRERRREALASAWQRAHVVRLAEVEALVDLPWKAEP